jgi:hypothetical protein
VTAVLALLASLAGFSARPAAAGLVSGDSVPETTVLPTNVDVLPGDTADTGTYVLTVPIRLQAGQSRRISDQLTVTVPRAAVVQNIVECVDPLSGNPVTVAGRPEAHSSGTNYSPSMGQLSMHASFLFTAPVTGTFFCQIRAQTDAGNDLGFHMTVVAAPRPGGTWLEIDNFTDAAPLWWQINTCDSTGSDPNCVFLGRPGGREHPTTAILHGWPSTFLDTPFLHMSDLWVAPPERDHRRRGRPHADHVLLHRDGVLPGARTGRAGKRSLRRGGVPDSPGPPSTGPALRGLQGEQHT